MRKPKGRSSQEKRGPRGGRSAERGAAGSGSSSGSRSGSLAAARGRYSSQRAPSRSAAGFAPQVERGLVKAVGTEACRALFEKRPEDITEVLVIDRVAAAHHDLAAFCARAGRPFRVVALADLSHFTETQRHDGICIIARRKREVPFKGVLTAVDQSPGPLALLLADRLRNPNNIGALLRVAGHFGLPSLLAAGESAGLSMASLRTSEGAAERVDLVAIADPQSAIAALKSHGMSIVATSSHAARRLGDGLLPKRAVFMVGSENAGISPELAGLADLTIAIPGAGTIESLNVACAASVILWEHWRTWRTGATTAAPASTSAPQRRT